MNHDLCDMNKNLIGNSNVDNNYLYLWECLLIVIIPVLTTCFLNQIKIITGLDNIEASVPHADVSDRYTSILSIPT